MNSDIIAAKSSPEMLDYLLKRRSVPIKDLRDLGPDEAQIEKIIRAASRVPDHGKLFPWYFLVFKGSARQEAGAILARVYAAKDPAAPAEKLVLEQGRFLRAPLVIAVVSRIRKSKNPAWEQILSAGAACQNLCLAANALGYGANWVTEWYAYDPDVRAALGLDARDHIAGFVYIGTPAVQPAERERPAPEAVTTFWEPGKPLQKGDSYDREAMDWPAAGFDFSGI